MNRRIPHGGAILAIAVLAAASGGCSTMNNTEKDAGIGGAIGTGAGLALGAATHHPLLGAAVGGLAGAGVGAAVGSDKDNQIQQQRDIQYANAQAQAQAQANAQRMGITDVVQMVQQGQDPQVIVNQIHNTGSVFQLSSADLYYLKQNNVPPMVISEMQNARPVAMAPPPPPPGGVVYQTAPPVVVVEPRPYYRPYGYGWGGGYYRRW